MEQHKPQRSLKNVISKAQKAQIIFLNLIGIHLLIQNWLQMLEHQLILLLSTLGAFKHLLKISPAGQGGTSGGWAELELLWCRIIMNIDCIQNISCANKTKLNGKKGDVKLCKKIRKITQNLESKELTGQISQKDLWAKSLDKISAKQHLSLFAELCPLTVWRLFNLTCPFEPSQSVSLC